MRLLRYSVLFCLLWLAGLRSASAQAFVTSGADSGAASAPGDLNFDFFPEQRVQPDPAQQERARRIASQGKLRRSLLTAHQIGGFVTLASLAATVIVGHLNYHDRYVSGDFSDRYQIAHRGLAIATTGLFTGTGLLALTAPNPYPKQLRLDTALVHKLAMLMATAGMATQVVLGAVVASRDGRLDQPGLALGHVVVGYATWAFMATGVVAYFF